MVENTRTVLLNAHARCPASIEMELWTFAFRHVVSQWNNTPKKSINYLTPDEKFNNLKRQTSKQLHFKNFHPFGFTVYILNDKLQDRN